MTLTNNTFPLFSIDGLSQDEVEKLAFETGFCKRKSGKINVSHFLQTFCVESLRGTVSYNDLAARVEAKTGNCVSRQGYHQRFGEECVEFFKRVLETVIQSKVKTYEKEKLLGIFNRVLVQDSTIVRLPKRLFNYYSGVKNASATVCNARVQGTYDLLSRQFMKFSVDSYKKNDLDAAGDISIEPGDLIIRDRGYVKLDNIADMKAKGGDSLFLYKHKIALFDCENGKKINLLEHLQKYGEIDKVVYAGSTKKLRIRIVARPVCQETANLRKMRAKKNRAIRIHQRKYCH